jgi:hypothetical protein
MRAIKIITTALIIAPLFFSSCVIARKKKAEKLLENVQPDPINYNFTLKAKITDIISIKAQIENTSGTQNFMLDTGSPLTYSYKTRDSFNLATKKLFSFGSNRFHYGSGSITLGNVKFKNAGFLVTDYILNEYREVAGLIGSSILQNSICELNFADSTIKISNLPENFTNTERAYVTAFKPRESQGTPVVKLMIGNDTVTAFIDTGFEGMIRLNKDVKIPVKEAGRQETCRNIKYFNGAKKDDFVKMTYYQPHHFAFSGMDLDSVPIAQDQQYRGKNLVGLAFLKQFIVTINWVNHRIYFKPINKITFKKAIYTYGFTCWLKDKKLRVLDVYKGSEIEKAGIKSGDIIASINKSTVFTNAMVSEINSNSPGTRPIQIVMKNNITFELSKKKLFE